MASTIDTLLTATEKFTFPDRVHPTTRQRAMVCAGYDYQCIERLLTNARLHNPNHSEQWYWEKILCDLEHDRGFC
jgi:hypothetical protein